MKKRYKQASDPRIKHRVEWSRPFGLNVLVWGLDPIYNVFS